MVLFVWQERNDKGELMPTGVRGGKDRMGGRERLTSSSAGRRRSSSREVQDEAPDPTLDDAIERFWRSAGRSTRSAASAVEKVGGVTVEATVERGAADGRHRPADAEQPCKREAVAEVKRRR